MSDHDDNRRRPGRGPHQGLRLGPHGGTALDEVSVEFGRGQLTAIMGSSGSGKSTLLHVMAGLDSPTSGQCT